MSSDRFFMVAPLSYFSFKPVLLDWCNKGRGMCYPVCRIMHTKEPLLLIRKSSPYNGGSEFPLLPSGPNPYVRHQITVNMFMKTQTRKEMFYLTTHSKHFIYGYMASDMVKDHSDSEKGNPLPPHRLLLSINSKGSFICTIPQTG